MLTVNSNHATPSTKEVIHRIEKITASIIELLDRSTHEHPIAPTIRALPFSHPSNSNTTNTTDSIPTRTLTNLGQCRHFASITLILSFVHSLLLQGRTTSTREVYYFYVTHFRSQRECDACILDVARLLNVGRMSLGLSASPKGWFCGRIQIKRTIMTQSSSKKITMDGSCTSSIQGIPITSEWIQGHPSFSSGSSTPTNPEHKGPSFQITSDARCILLIEKEGIYTRLSEDNFYETYPCILITGRGFPDLATRAFVNTLYQTLQIPIFGICDCNPFGVSVLQTFEKGGSKMGLDATLYSVPVYWLGLRPSHVMVLHEDFILQERKKQQQQNKDSQQERKDKSMIQEAFMKCLPSTVFQQMTDLDYKRIQRLITIEEEKTIHDESAQEKLEELKLMKRNGYKVELEALHWLGMDYLTSWLEEKIQSLHLHNRC